MAHDVWKSDVCLGLDPQAVAKELAGRGHLRTEKDKDSIRYQVRERVPGEGRVRVYAVAAAILDSGDTDDTVAALGDLDGVDLPGAFGAAE